MIVLQRIMCFSRHFLRTFYIVTFDFYAQTFGRLGKKAYICAKSLNTLTETMTPEEKARVKIDRMLAEAKREETDISSQAVSELEKLLAGINEEL